MDNFEAHPCTLFWNETKKALSELEGLLKCSICTNRLNEPLSIGSCNHHFCKLCIETAHLSVCPQCGLPAWRKEMNTDHQLSSVLSLVEELGALVFTSYSSTSTNNTTNTINTINTTSTINTINTTTTNTTTNTTTSTTTADPPSSCSSSSCSGSPSRTCARPPVAGSTALSVGKDTNCYTAGTEMNGNELHKAAAEEMVGVDVPPLAAGKEADVDGSSSEPGVFRTPKLTTEMIHSHILHRLGPLSVDRLVRSRRRSSNKDNRPPGGGGPFRGLEVPRIPQSNLPSKEDVRVVSGIRRDPVVTRKRRSSAEVVKSKRKRPAVDPASSTTTPQLPSTPLITKTRHFAQLNTQDKISRLRDIYGRNVPTAFVRRVRQGRCGDPCNENAEVSSTLSGSTPHFTPPPPAFQSTPTVTKTRYFAALNTPERESRLRGVLKDLQTAERRAAPPKTVVLKRSAAPVTAGSEAVECNTAASPRLSAEGGAGMEAKPLKQLRRNVRGETPFHLACIKGDAEEVGELLKKGYDPNIKDHAGWTPLHEACNHGFLEIVEILLDGGALVNVPGYDNETPLHDAINNSHAGIVQLLLARGADIELRNKHGLRPLDYARTDEMKRVCRDSPSPTQPANSLDRFKSPKSSPHVSSRPVGLVLVLTSLDSSQRTGVSRTAASLGGKVATKFAPNVTHLVTNVNGDKCCPRTMKYFAALTQGTWIVSYDWVLESQRRGCWVEEEGYEVEGAVTVANTYLTSAPRTARLNRALQYPGLFDGCDFFFAGSLASSSPSKEELAHMIQQLDGCVLSREPRESLMVVRKCPYHAESNSVFTQTNTFILYDPSVIDSRALLKWMLSKSVAIASVAWLLDCITHFKLRPLIVNKSQ